MNNKYISVNLTVVLLTLLSVSNSHAEFSPAVVKAGGIDIVPVLGLFQSYDSNMLYSNADEKTSMITLIKPKVTVSTEVGANTYSVGAGVSIGSYSESRADDYVDSNLSLDLHQSFSRKAELDIKAGRLNTHEARGADYSSGAAAISITEPDKYHINHAEGTFSYGSKDAIGRIVFNLSSDTRIYDSRRTQTKTRDRDSVGAGVTFFYHVMPKTSLLFELSQRELVYSNRVSDNSIEQRAYAGASWDISALTTGTAKGGLLEKNFDDATKDSFSGFSWEIGARWTPLSYSVIDVLTSGKTEETNGSGNYIDSKNVLVKWAHFWSERLNTVLDVNVTKNNYQPSPREDDFVSVGLQLNYNLRRWLNIGGGYTYSENGSSQDEFDYAKNIFSISLMMGL
ncbi:MAG: outer membrane beta-barrel protein [Gammaproteobacteria bacterium]|nr:outer membrane beta-barrel protein [Gammaproteobacteria bacterium]